MDPNTPFKTATIVLVLVAKFASVVDLSITLVCYSNAVVFAMI